MNNKVLNHPEFKKFLNHFNWSYESDSIEIIITYDGMTYETICKTIGCIVMGMDPYFTLANIEPEDVNNVFEIYAMPPWERESISKLFEYFEYECPRKVLKKTIKELNTQKNHNQFIQ